jgi:hydroxyacylglutathione hydrolase
MYTTRVRQRRQNIPFTGQRGDPEEGKMILKRFYDEKLAQASYLVGCAATGEALVVDPNRDVEQFVVAAEAEELRITHITETHIHADFVSGARELAERTGARLYLSDEGDENWKYAFTREYDAVLLKDGDNFKVGNVKIDVLHTPGHTPEHLSFVVTDTAGADQPMGVFTGDFIFVGDVGRPDLLERAAKYTGTMEQGARGLFRSLRRFADAFPDYVQLWPGHGAGSACGKALGAVPQTTLGYEKRFNWGLATQGEEEFVRMVLAGQPEPPMYFAEMKRINKEGPRLLGGFHRPQRLPENRLEELLAQGAVVVDTRHASEFAAGHIPGTINVPLGRSFTTWAGSVLPYERDFYLIVEDAPGEAVEAVVRDLAMIGLDRVAGCFSATVVQTWIDTNRAAEGVPEVSPEQLQSLLAAEAVELLDVRNSSEWEEGHIPGSRNFPLGRLPETLEQIPQEKPLVVYCQTGGRAAVAIGVLQAQGFHGVSHLTGDFAVWSEQERPVRTGGAVPAAV